MQIWHWFGGIYAILYEPPMVIQVNHGPHTHTHTHTHTHAGQSRQDFAYLLGIRIV